jgi:SanA protein
MSVLTIQQKREILRRQRNLQRFLYGIVAFGLVLISAMLLGNTWVKSRAEPFVYHDINRLPPRPVGLLLGTAKWVATGVKNEYFVYRVEAAALLYHNQKVQRFIISGDSSRYYNEPKEMLDALLALGVPSTAITLDYAGFRTFDSILRCRKKYNQNNITIITQTSHNYRALFIAHANAMNAVGYCANAPEGEDGKRNYREFWARLGAIMDVYVFRTQPRNMGDTVNINI